MDLLRIAHLTAESRFSVDGNWVVTSGFLFVGTGFSHWEFARGDWVVYETIFGGGVL